MDMKQFRVTNSGRYEGRKKSGSIIREQYISLTSAQSEQRKHSKTSESLSNALPVTVMLSHIA